MPTESLVRKLVLWFIRSRSITAHAVRIGCVCAITLAAAEATARMMGEHAFWPRNVNITVTPGGRFYQKHATLGYRHLPGQFRFTLPSGQTTTVTHRPDTLRITHPLDTYDQATAKPEIWVFGCSYTHGWSLNDDETYCWRLQEILPDYEIVNFGVGGYANVHALIQLTEALANRPTPACVVVSYASFHDERNALLRNRRRSVAAFDRLGLEGHPYAKLDRNGHLTVATAEVIYRPVPGMRVSAVANAMDKWLCEVQTHAIDAHAVSKAIIAAISDLCRQHQAPMVLAGIERDGLTAEVIGWATDQAMLATDMSVDLSQPGMRNYPHDSHPSPAANRIYAAKLHTYLANTVLTPPRTDAVETIAARR